MTLILSPEHKKVVSDRLRDTSPKSISDATVSVALFWGYLGGVDETDVTDEGATALLEAQRRISELEQAVTAGVEDGTIIPNLVVPSLGDAPDSLSGEVDEAKEELARRL